MTAQPFIDRLETLLRDHFEIDSEALHADATFEDLELDSLGMAEILAIVEDEEGVRIPEDLGISLRTTLSEAACILTAFLDGQATSSSAASAQHQAPQPADDTTTGSVTPPSAAAGEPASVTR